jgi:Flp pilus assembly protein TadB
LSDFVVAALLSTIENRSRDLSGLLTQLSSSAREECRLHLRVWVSRSRTRSAVRIVGGSLLTFVMGLALFDAEYLAPYATASGVVVLAVVCSGFGTGLWLLHRMSQFETPVRLIGVRAR